MEIIIFQSQENTNSLKGLISWCYFHFYFTFVSSFNLDRLIIKQLTFMNTQVSAAHSCSCKTCTAKSQPLWGPGGLYQRLNVHFRYPCSFIHSAVFSCLKDLSQEVLSVWAKGKDHTVPSSFHVCESLI